jgi:hypothetical protein
MKGDGLGVRLRITLGAISIALAAALGAPSVSSASITVGSDLTLAAASSPENCILSAPPCTRLAGGYHAGNLFPFQSPTKGTVTSFGIKTGMAETVTFRLGRFSDPNWSGSGTGPTVALPGPGTYSIPTLLPIAAGDNLGLDGSATRAVSGLPGGCLNNAGYLLFNPPLTNGVAQPADSNNACELLVNAVITPANTFKFGTFKARANGSGVLIVVVPGPGRLSLSRGARGGLNVNRAGAAKLKVKPIGAAKARLAATGRVTIKPKVTFSPTGGTPRSLKHRIRLHL